MINTASDKTHNELPSKMGKLIGASLGPGDPGLITRHAWNALNSNAVWAYPVRRRGGQSFALSITERAGLPVPAAALALVFPMTQDVEILAVHWLRAAETVLENLRRGQDVVFLVEGDASTYSTFNHLSRTVCSLAADVEVEVIPGVTSYLGAAARLNMAFADVDDTVAIIPAAYGLGVIERMLEEFDTLVLLKVKPLLDDLIDLLDRKSLLEHSAFVEKIGTPDERIVKNVSSLVGEKVNYLSLLLVKNPDRIKGERVKGCRKKSAVPQGLLVD